LTKTRRSSDKSATAGTTKKDNAFDSSSSYSEQLKSFYDHMGIEDKPLFNWDNLASLDNKLMKISYKTIMQRGEKLLNKIKSAKLASIDRAKSIPNNATIRREYVKCGKPDCQERHGPYYYAYWKDANNNKKLKKKYIGKHFQRRKNNEDKNDVKTVKAASTNYERNNDSRIIKDFLKTNKENNSSIANIKSNRKKTKKRSLLIIN
jgi:hypothetical protein